MAAVVRAIYGLPFVATEHVGRLLEDAAPGRHFLSAVGPSEFAGALELLLGDPASGSALGREGSRLVASCYSVDALAGRLAR